MTRIEFTLARADRLVRPAAPSVQVIGASGAPPGPRQR
jgi:hypothetical protein